MGIEKCLRQAAELIHWEDGDWKRHVTPDGKWRAKGIACGIKLTGTPSTSSVVLKFNDDASVQILQSGMELGQGVNTVIPQFVAERLGIPYENVSVTPVDTMFTPYEKTTTGSRLTFHVGNAAVKAADDVIDQLRGLAAIAWKTDKERVTFSDGVLYGPDGQSQALRDIGKTSFMKEQEPVLGRGHLLNGNMVDFKAATAKDTQFNIKVALVENPVDDNPYGARGIGEPPVVPPAADISAAVSRACGTRLTSIPLKSDEVLGAIRASANERGGV